MLIWFALLIPVIAAGILVYKFHHRVVWWELVIPMAITIPLIVIFKEVTISVKTSDTSYLSTYVVTAQYFEAWSEQVTYFETETDSDGNSRMVMKTRIDHHPPRWYVVDNAGNRHSITQQMFNRLTQDFGNLTDRGYYPYSGVVVDPGKWFTSEWNGQEATMEVLASSYSYTNRVQVSRSVFGYRQVTKEENDGYQLFDYPPIDGEYKQLAILGYDNEKADYLLRNWNAKLGVDYQIKIWLLVFIEQDIDAAYEQENYWCGGNDNELVLCVGLSTTGEVKWGHVFSWTEREQFKANVKQCIADQIGQPFEPEELINRTANLVPGGWQKKDFNDFNYLTVELPTWVTVITYILVFMISIACSLFAIYNEVNPK